MHSWTSIPNRINDLEEEVRDLQVQARDTEEQEQKRSREMIARMEREKHLEVENYAIRYENSICEVSEIYEMLQ